MIVSGLRGVGKTVLLLEFASIADSEGWIVPEHIEITSDTDFRAELADQAHDALIKLSRRKAVGERIKRFTNLLKGFKVGASAEGDLEFSFDPEAVVGATGNLERDLTTLFVELGQTAKEHGTGMVFLVDEMQFLKKAEMEALAAAMHRMSQKTLPIALAGTGLPQLPGLMVDAKSCAERLFAYPALGPLSESAARAALTAPATEEGVDYASHALELIVERSECYPTFIQAYGREVWNVAPASPITRADVEAAEPLVTKLLDEEFFHVRFEKATATERRYMAAMADLGDGPYRSAAVAERSGRTPRGAAPHRDALIKKGLIYATDHGELDFTVPHFAAFMRRRYPLASTDP